MRLHKKLYFVRIICLIGWVLLTLTMQAQIPVGAWRDHLAYSHCKKVVKVKSKLFCATEQNIFSYNTADNSFEKLSTITGLFDMGIATMEYTEEKDILLVAYTNGNIDIIKNNQIINIADLKSKSILGSKEAHHIYFLNDFAYLSYSFGILVIDLNRFEIKDNYIIGDPDEKYAVNALTSDGTNFYAATSKGIFKALVNDPFLVNFNQWQRVTNIDGSTDEFSHIVNFNGVIVAGKAMNTPGNPLFIYSNGLWVNSSANLPSAIKELRVSGNRLLATVNNHAYLLNEMFQLVNDFNYSNPNSALYDGTNIWVADAEAGLIKVTMNSNEPVVLYPNGPYVSHVNNMIYTNGSVVVTGGGVNQSWGNLYRKGELYTFKDETWNSYINWDAFDYMLPIADPADPSKLYAGSWGKGIFVYKDNQIAANYSYTNSSLQSAIGGADYVDIAGMAFDQNNNLWVTNSGVSSPVSVLKTDGTWKSFPYGPYLNVNTMGPIHVDRNGQFWVVLPRMMGLFVFDINKTIDNEDDDRYLKFKPLTYFGEPISNIFCVTSDKDGSVWVGTDKGPVVYSRPETVLNGETAGTQPTIKRQDAETGTDVLLGTETINCITVDGGNRKWFGTEKGGAFLISADGQKQIYHFNTDNSPIFSNTIRSITINDKTGEVFFGTDLGIISFRAIATAPNDDFSNAYVFPNPVRPEYNGDIIISGLVADADVKITDISGNLVYQTKSQGGQAIWDGRIRSGRRAATGVYLIFLTNDDGSATRVIKLLMVK
ncbi:MAG TPA: T9SS type A sorting domain-containing protein [Bacteroidales bacterium]|nr:T9SS type A sorting domain-containing protein [Bacteroidales bacterium]